MNMEKIRRRLDVGNVCRRCINKKLHVNLRPENCKYFQYPSVCDVCGKNQNIVAELKLSGKFKTMFH